MLFFESFMKVGFVTHDTLSDFLAKYLRQTKIGLLAAAHLSLIGFFFPQFARGFGSLAQGLLLIVILVSPLSKLFRVKLLYQIMSLRRELGIWFAYAGLVHGAGYMLDPDWFAAFIAPHATQPLSVMLRYIFGILALIFTLPLLITSNNVSLRLLKGNWKKVHFLVYPMFAFMLLHIMLPRGSRSAGYYFSLAEFFTAFGAYVLLKQLAKNNFLMPIEEAIAYVARKYAEYRMQKA